MGTFAYFSLQKHWGHLLCSLFRSPYIFSVWFRSCLSHSKTLIFFSLEAVFGWFGSLPCSTQRCLKFYWAWRFSFVRKCICPATLPQSPAMIVVTHPVPARNPCCSSNGSLPDQLSSHRCCTIFSPLLHCVLSVLSNAMKLYLENLVWLISYKRWEWEYTPLMQRNAGYHLGRAHVQLLV